MISVAIPKDVKVSWGEEFVKVEGPLGVLIKNRSGLELALKDSRLYLLTEQKEDIGDFYLSTMRYLMLGVSKGYRRKLRLVGVGFRASVVNNRLILKIGYSHEVSYQIPTDVKIVCSKAKGTLIVVKGVQAYRVNQVASEIRALRVPDAYKGKGIQFDKEIIKLKKGKREGK